MNSISSIDEIIHDYETVVKVVDTDASEQTERAYGGVVRAMKGKLQEHITLKGERDIENPIHKTFKPLEHKIVKKAVKLIENHLKGFII